MRIPLRRAALVMSAVAVALPAAASAAAPQATRQIVTVPPDMPLDQGRVEVERAGGTVVSPLAVIHGLEARLTPAQVRALQAMRKTVTVYPNRPVKAAPARRRSRPRAANQLATTPVPLATGTTLLTAFNQSLGTDKLWSSPSYATGRGVTVAVIDTGIAGNLPDFRVSRTDATSRVIASVVTNPYATSAADGYGHGTHIAGLIAGNGFYRPTTDALMGKYAGTAPDANLIAIKASDDHGNATLLDVIYGLQFAVDFKATYGIRVVNLSLESSVAAPYRTDPLDAAVESAWLHGLVVVAAAGNRGTASDAVAYAPGNDPYAISVGAVDDMGTKTLQDDKLAAWSSRGLTQDGFAKPDMLAPGARMVSLLAPGSDYSTACLTCVVSAQYIRVGGTSMAAAVTSGVVADLLQVHPTWTPDQVKAALMGTTRLVGGVGREIAADAANRVDLAKVPKLNVGLTPSTLLDPATWDIDPAKASWSRASWSSATTSLRASWSKASWSCACSTQSDGTIDPARASWSKASWSSAWDK